MLPVFLDCFVFTEFIVLFSKINNLLLLVYVRYCFQFQRLNYTMPGTSKRKTDLPEGHSNGDSSGLKHQSHQFLSKEEEALQRQHLVLWRQPLRTMEYFSKELVIDLYTYGKK